MTALYDEHMASPNIKGDDYGYPEPPSRGRLAKWVTKSWDQIDGTVVLLSWGKSGLLLPLDGSGDDAWAKKELHSDTQGNRLDAETCEQEAEPEAGEEDLLEVFHISDDDGMGMVTRARTMAMLTKSDAVWNRETGMDPTR